MSAQILFSTRIGLLLVCLFTGVAYGLQIDSVRTTTSTCPNNGSITVYAKTSAPPLVYSITAGPFTQPLQTSNVFSSLPLGNYTVKVSDGSGASLTANTVITGSYTPLDFNPLTTPVTCVGSTDGKIVGNRTSNTGQGPFTWQLIAPSPKTTAPQSSDTFTNLPPGNYTVRVTDVCGNYRTLVATISTPSTDFVIEDITTIKVGCDSMYVKAQIYFFDAIRVPMTLTYRTKNGSFTTTTFTMIDSSELRNFKTLTIGQTIPNLTYGDYVQINARNACGDTYLSTHYIDPYYFYPSYTLVDCNQAKLEFENTNDENYLDGLMLPLTFSLTDVAADTVVETNTYTISPANKYIIGYTGVGFKNTVTIGNTYKFSITDGCGQTFTQSYTIPSLSNPKIIGRDIIYAPCLDSVLGCYRIQISGFSSDAVLTILSGPSKLGSTKPGYEYQATYTYPMTFPVNAGGYFFLYNLPVGTYNYTITDHCGNKVSSSIVVKSTDISNLGRKVSYVKGCLGKNTIYYTISYGANINTGSLGEVTVKNITTGTILSQVYPYQNIYSGSVSNVPSGQYEITFDYGGAGPTIGNLLDKRYHACSILKDTITIEGYETPEIYTGNSILCHNTINLQIVPDSSKGVPPYQYEVISGPQTFPVQNSNLFTVNTPGIYTVRIYDVCGNATAKQIYVSPISSTLLPAAVTKSCDKIHLAYTSSLYYKYKWTRPNHTTFISDSLVLDPITPADTGTYQIAQLVNINGCKDTLYASYHVALGGATYKQSATICPGSTVAVGTHVYSAPGVYKDTLVNSIGCDSIIQLTLLLSSYKYTTINKTICNGQTISFGTHTYSQSGTYYDTLATSACDSIVTLKLSVSSPSINLGNDTTICQGQQLTLDAGAGYAAYYWNNNYLDSTHQSIVASHATRYWVEVKNSAGCKAADTLTLDLYALPSATTGNDTTICSGDKIQLTASGGSHYQWLADGANQAIWQVSPVNTTIYHVVVSDAHQCSDTAAITVYVKPAPAKQPFENSLQTYCLEEGPVEIGPSWGNTFLWTGTGDTSRQIQITQAGVYEVKVFDSTGCWIKSTVTIDGYCSPLLLVPSAFSPNADGANDELEIFGKYFIDFKIMIFNRWGEVIFISTDQTLQWDGNYRGEPMEIGTYPWTISYRSKYKPEEEKRMKGSVTLIR